MLNTYAAHQMMANGGSVWESFSSREATVHTAPEPTSLASITLNGTTDSYLESVTLPGTGDLYYAMTVKGTDAAGTLISRSDANVFGGRYEANPNTGISSGPVITVSVDGTTFVSGTNTRTQLKDALMDGQPHFVLCFVGNVWSNLLIGNHTNVAGQHVAGVLARIGILHASAPDYAAALEDAQAIHAKIVSDYSL